MNQLFPRFEAIRHAVAHAAEFVRDATTTKAHAVTGPVEIAPGLVVGDGTKVFISSGLINREFTCTIDGQAQSYEVSKATLDGLTEVRIEIYTAFSPAEIETCAGAANKQNPSADTPLISTRALSMRIALTVGFEIRCMELLLAGHGANRF